MKEKRLRSHQIIVTINRRNPASLVEVSEITGIPLSTLKRRMAEITDEFGIEFDRATLSDGASRWFISDWGWVNKAMYLARFSDVLA